MTRRIRLSASFNTSPIRQPVMAHTFDHNDLVNDVSAGCSRRTELYIECLAPRGLTMSSRPYPRGLSRMNFPDFASLKLGSPSGAVD